jgi:carnosine N-methyltransferase
MEAPPDKNDGIKIRSSEQHRNKAVLHSVAREWSENGAEEREMAFAPMLAELKKYLPINKDNAYTKRVLVPGCGLGRLPVEVAAHGYAAEGNEFSAFMLMASNFVMNEVDSAKSWDICPWLDSVCNVINTSDPYTPIQIPDRTASDIINSSEWANTNADEKANVPFPRLSMAAGDFVELYGENSSDAKSSYDGILTCFFVDTAPVVVDYIETIWHLLKPGGVWVNLGPLLYHWTTDSDNNGDGRYDQSIELSWEELKHVLEQVGFEIQVQSGVNTSSGASHARINPGAGEDKVRFINACYSRPDNQLMWTQYNAMLFTATKPL